MWEEEERWRDLNVVYYGNKSSNISKNKYTSCAFLLARSVTLATPFAFVLMPDIWLFHLQSNHNVRYSTSFNTKLKHRYLLIAIPERCVCTSSIGAIVCNYPYRQQSINATQSKSHLTKPIRNWKAHLVKLLLPVIRDPALFSFHMFPNDNSLMGNGCKHAYWMRVPPTTNRGNWLNSIIPLRSLAPTSTCIAHLLKPIRTTYQPTATGRRLSIQNQTAKALSMQSGLKTHLLISGNFVH